MFRQFCICLLLAVSSRVLAGPIAVTLAGNFGTPVGSPTVFDQQGYQVTFVIADPHSPATFVDVPGPLGQVSVTYHVPARLSVPGIGLTADSNIDVNYNDQAPVGFLLNIAVFTGLPVGDFLILTPLQTIRERPSGMGWQAHWERPRSVC
jgi:hypothetical protein